MIESAMRHPRLHPRRSTSFLLVMIPLIGGLSYEVLKAPSKPAAWKYFGFVYRPGLMMHRLTTREPSANKLEVAIAAPNASLADNLLESRQFID